MANTVVLYLDSYGSLEAGELHRCGVPVLRANSDAVGALRASFPEIGTCTAVLRGEKLTPLAYKTLYENLLEVGVTPRTTPHSYEVLSDSARYEEPIADHVPPKRAFEIGAATIVEDLRGLGGWGRAFIRSELGSAAKFAGVEACVIETFSTEEIFEKVKVLRDAFPTARRLTARGVEEVRKVGGKPAEGRFVVLDGACRYMDHFEVSDVAVRREFESRYLLSAQDIALALKSADVTGDYFLDIAEKADGTWFVVEIKPLLNGTIRDLSGFAAALLASKSA